MSEADRVGVDVPAVDASPDALPGPLPDRVRARVLALASDSLGRMPRDQVPPSLVRVAAFTPARRARLAASQIASVLDADAEFRGRVADDVRDQVPELAEAVTTGTAPSAADPVDLAAVAYLLRPPGWTEIVAAAGDTTLARDSDAEQRAARQLEQLRRQLDQVNRVPAPDPRPEPRAGGRPEGREHRPAAQAR